MRILLTALLIVAPVVAQEAERPNVLLIISDDQGWADFGFMGSAEIRTPHLDTLAGASLVFPRGPASSKRHLLTSRQVEKARTNASSRRMSRCTWTRAKVRAAQSPSPKLQEAIAQRRPARHRLRQGQKPTIWLPSTMRQTALILSTSKSCLKDRMTAACAVGRPMRIERKR